MIEKINSGGEVILLNDNTIIVFNGISYQVITNSKRITNSETFYPVSPYEFNDLMKRGVIEEKSREDVLKMCHSSILTTNNPNFKFYGKKA